MSCKAEQGYFLAKFWYMPVVFVKSVKLRYFQNRVSFSVSVPISKRHNRNTQSSLHILSAQSFMWPDLVLTSPI